MRLFPGMPWYLFSSWAYMLGFLCQGFGPFWDLPFQIFSKFKMPRLPELGKDSAILRFAPPALSPPSSARLSLVTEPSQERAAPWEHRPTGTARVKHHKARACEQSAGPVLPNPGVQWNPQAPHTYGVLPRGIPVLLSTSWRLPVTCKAKNSS